LDLNQLTTPDHHHFTSYRKSRLLEGDHTHHSSTEVETTTGDHGTVTVDTDGTEHVSKAYVDESGNDHTPNGTIPHDGTEHYIPLDVTLFLFLMMMIG
jgi:hypothetical protein